MGQFAFRYGVPVAARRSSAASRWALRSATSTASSSRKIRLPPFIVTLGMWQIVLAANFLYSRNETIRSQDIEAQAPIAAAVRPADRGGGATLTLGVIAMVALVLALDYVLNHTAWGRHVYAIGDDPDAAELAGVQVKRTLISVYVARGADLRAGRLGADRPHRLGRPRPRGSSRTSRASPRW